MLTGLSAGTTVAFAEYKDDYDFDDRLEYFCEMNEDEKNQLFEEHPRLAQFEDRLNEFCELEEEERDELIEQFVSEHFPKYKEHDDWEMKDILEDYCEMTDEEKSEFIEKYPMVADHQEKMEEYCSLDESEREAFIEEHEDEYEKENDYRKYDYDLEDMLEKYCEMTDEEKEAFAEKHDKAADHQEKMEEYCSLDESEREAFIEEHEDEYEKENDYRKHDYDMREKMDEFCEMTDEEKIRHIEEKDKSEEHLEQMNEYCTLDEAGRDAFISEHKSSMKDKMSEHKDKMKDKISDHKDSMKSDLKPKSILRASTLSVEQKDEIKAMHSELRDLKHSLRDQSITDSEKETLRDKFIEKAKDFAMTWLSPRHQVAAGIDAQLVECREGYELVMKTSNATPLCVKHTTAEKLIERGIAVSAI